MGSFATEEEAALVVDACAKQLYGDAAHQNFPGSITTPPPAYWPPFMAGVPGLIQKPKEKKRGRAVRDALQDATSALTTLLPAGTRVRANIGGRLATVVKTNHVWYSTRFGLPAPWILPPNRRLCHVWYSTRFARLLILPAWLAILRAIHEQIIQAVYHLACLQNS
jgi:hypothetical protein